MEPAYNVNPEYVRLVPTWKAAATIFTQNLLYCSDVSIKQTSVNELIKMGAMIDQYNNTDTMTEENQDEVWDCQP